LAIGPLPSLEGKHDGRRVVLPVAVLGADKPSDLTFETGTALLDTGATSSAITPRFVRQLGLLSTGKRPIMVATEQRLLDFFVFRLGLFENAGPLLGNSQWPHVFAETEGFQIQQSHNFDVLLGMDVIGQCDLKMERSGTWCLEFG
jgi:hypothetical protein